MLSDRWGVGVATLALMAGAVARLWAQETPKYKVDVSVVNILATVRDQNGRMVNDLAKDDFVLPENGKRQEIQYFSRQNDLPLTIGLLIDTSRSQRRLIDEERQASYQFLEQVLRPEKDLAFIIRFDMEAELLQDLTSSRPLLDHALNRLQFPGARRPPAATREDSTSQAEEVMFSQIPGMPWPRPRMPGGRAGRNPGDRRVLVTVGGTVLFDAVYLVFEVGKKLTLQEIFNRIQEELRSQYSLGYTPAEQASGEFRRIELKTTRDKLEVITRTGYYPRHP